MTTRRLARAYAVPASSARRRAPLAARATGTLMPVLVVAQFAVYALSRRLPEPVS